MKNNLFKYFLHIIFFNLLFCHIAVADNAIEISSMTLDEKIGQLVMVPYSGQFVNEESEYFKKLKDVIVDKKIGGLILYGGTPLETVFLNNKLQSLAKIPIFIAADAEYGITHQIKNLFDSFHKKGVTSGPLSQDYFAAASTFPSNMAIGATRNEDFAYFQGQVTANEAKSLGINWILGPVLDVNNNPENPVINIRSYGENPALVARLGRAYIQGAQENGVIATAKHFPGHGNTDTDSHFELPKIDRTLKELMGIELIPFKKAIKAGVKSIMTAHMLLPKLDEQYPSTLSENILTNLLREKLSFNGLIITDAMLMDAITKNFGLEKAIIRSFNAGADIILTPSDPIETINIIKKALNSGEIKMERIDQSVKRILDVKKNLDLGNRRFSNVNELNQILAKPSTLEKIEDFSCQAITLLKNKKKHLPFDTSKARKLLIVTISRMSGIWSFETLPSYDADNSNGVILQEKLKHLVQQVEEVRIPKNFELTQIQAITDKAKEFDAIIISAFYGVPWGEGIKNLSPSELQLVQNLFYLGKPVTFVAFGNPYIIKEAPFIDSYVATFSVNGPMETCVVQTVMGKRKFTGKSPVTIPGL